MPMGVACAPDMFQSIICDLLGHLDYCLCYIDDVLILRRAGESEDEHLKNVKTVLQLLQDAGFRANLRKSFFMQKTVEYLGYQLTSDGLTTQPKKIEAMQRVIPPENAKQLKRFLGMINFYRDVFEQ